MTTEERRALLDRAITTYGAPAQMDMAVEEMAELTKALCKVKRVSCAAEARAALENAVEEAKLERLKNRLDGRNNWRDSSLHKWIENQFSAGGNGHE